MEADRHAATSERIAAGGDAAFVPPYDERQLRDVDFESGNKMIPHAAGERSKGWQASPIVADDPTSGLGVALVNDRANSASGQFHVALGLGVRGVAAGESISAGAGAMLSQEVRNPRAGKFTFSLSACGTGTSSDFYRDTFLKNFACRLVIFGFRDLNKDHREQRIFATRDIQPAWCLDGQKAYERFEVSATLRSQDGWRHGNQPRVRRGGDCREVHAGRIGFAGGCAAGWHSRG